jgi:putative membrane protein
LSRFFYSIISGWSNVIKLLWAFIYLAVLIWSGIVPKDYFTWFLEVLPAMIGAGILLYTYHSFRLTPLLYSLILFHCLILMVGGHYTYAEVPLFDTIKELLDLERNNYDKVGHFVQGFVPAVIAREILIRKNVVNVGVNSQAWLNFFIVSICLAFSAFYELLEWWVAIASGENAEAFLGTQGYIWDTQSDMAVALFGAICAITFLTRVHDKQLLQLRS